MCIAIVLYFSQSSTSPDVVPNRSSGQVYEQLALGGYLSHPMEGQRKVDKTPFGNESELIYGDRPLQSVVLFARRVLLSRLMDVATCLYNVHGKPDLLL